ncbi:MAG: transcriptional regulator [Gammaproteobacteria bacterium]|nr:MAG: transcriptional regulator [Gammaproteobacteria bacterium]
MNVVGSKVKAIRTSKNLTQEELTAKCNLANWDISRGTLAKIESKVRRVTDIEVLRLASVLKISPNDLYSKKSIFIYKPKISNS